MSVARDLVCVIDDDQSVRRSLRYLFKSAGYEAELFDSAEEYLARENPSGPACLVLDVCMPGLNGLDLQHAIESRGTCEHIVFITGYGDVSICTRAMKNGAVDFLTKPFGDAELLVAIQSALKRSAEALDKHSQRQFARGKIDKLTPREFEVLRLVIVGMLNKEIAGELQTAEKTVKVHRGRVMHKLGVRSVPDLVRLSYSAGVAPMDFDIGPRSTIQRS